MWRTYQSDNLPTERWIALSSESLLQSPDWLDLWRVINYQPEYFICEGESEIGFVTQKTGSGALQRRQSLIDGLPARLLSGSNSIDRSVYRDALLALAAAGGARSTFVDYANSIDADSLPREWRSIATQTQRLDLSAGSEYSSEAKRHIDSAHNRGAIVRHISSQADVGGFYGLLEQTFSRHKRTRSYPLSLYRKIFELSIGDDRIVWLMCESKGEIIGAHIGLIERDELISWAPVMNRAHSDKKPAYALLDHLVTIARERKLRAVNLGGSPAGADGLRQFKARFGAHDYNYQTLVYQPKWARLLGVGKIK